jgi:phosphomethylpyrimidine synthase
MLSKLLCATPTGIAMSASSVIEDGLPASLSAGASAKAEALAKAGMAQMSAKFRDMGGQVYVEAKKVKESNKVL